uniref:Putative portal protein n=1 Tax=viral metagenome TaxID=1070528 RepID=A0A6M3IJ20_9ZZZZ
MEMRADYRAGKASRFQRVRSGVSTMGSGADYHIRNETQFLKTMEYALDMARNDTVVGAIVERSIHNLFHDGFGFDPQTGDSALDDDLKASFTEYANDPDLCDVSCRYTLHQMAEMVAWGVKVPGGAFVLPHARDMGPLELVEYQRCRTPSNTTKNVALGVLLDDYRKPLQYWFTKDELDPNQPLSRVSDIEQIDARDADGYETVWHIASPWRISQTRGVTSFAAVFEALGMFDDLHFSNIVKALVASCFTFIRETPSDFKGGKKGQHGARSTQTMSDGNTRLVEELSPGQEIVGRPGEKITAFTPNVPNAEFFDHAKFVLQLVCATQNLPIACFLLDGRETNFSGQRFASDQAKIGWRREQGFYARAFHRKAYIHHLRCRMANEPALMRQMVKLGNKLFAVAITRPAWPYMQPVQDIEARRRERELLLTSPRRQSQERAVEWSEVVSETVIDHEYAISLALEAVARIRDKHGVDIDPARLLYLDPVRNLIEVAADAIGGGTNGNMGAPAVNMNDYGIGVRAGAMTPQPEDEDYFRDSMGLPPANEQVKEAWAQEGVRRPITLAKDEDETNVPTEPTEGAENEDSEK